MPPSNQHQHGPVQDAPMDYQEHRNSELLDSPEPGPSAPKSTKRRRRLVRLADLNGGYTPPSRNKEAEEDDDEDPFETDERNGAKGKRPAASAPVPPAKYARLRSFDTLGGSPKRHTRGVSEDARKMPPPSSVPNFSAIEDRKRLIFESRRRTRLPVLRQRQPWTDHDSAVLLEVIRDRQAAWATIERLDNDRFEYPRNQQAYRDKARNMKVDCLMTDAILPPCFDLIALGKKEIDKLESCGKNPDRKEADIVDGKPIFTEFPQRM